MSKKKKGFTLLELMVVVIILGVMASFALPRFMTARSAGYSVEAITTLKILKDIAWAYTVKFGEGVWPTTWTNFGYPAAPNTAMWTYALTSTTAGGNLVITASGITGTPTEDSQNVVLTVTPLGVTTLP